MGCFLLSDELVIGFLEGSACRLCLGHMKNPAAGWERGEAGDFDGFRSGRRHPHRSAKRNKNYRKKEYAQRQHAQIGRRFRGAQDRSNGGAVGHRRTFQLGALMPLSMLRCNPPRTKCGRKMRPCWSRLYLCASNPLSARCGAKFHRPGSCTLSCVSRALVRMRMVWRPV